MDDSTFDRRSALDWIQLIESENARVRDTDMYPLLNSWLKGFAPVNILEVGSGQGICSTKIDLDSCEYTGVDPNPFLVDRAKNLYACVNRKFIQGNVYELRFSDWTFDAVFSITVWHLLADLQRATNELSRVLRPNGSFLIITANPGAYPAWTGVYSDTKSEGRRFEGILKNSDKSVSHDVLYLHTLSEITEALKSTHLEIEAVETFRALEGSGEQGRFVLIRGKKRPPIDFKSKFRVSNIPNGQS
jgi:ubiquinone/menaquinone biosynthesis C-methylase UbiE